MKLGADGFVDLTYCTNIHPGDNWEETLANIRTYGPALKQRLAPREMFGLGLRISAKECEELLAGDRLTHFKEFLKEEGLYVALINGFPYGDFHGRRIKENVFAPDWRSEARVDYTLNLIRVLKELLPPGFDGGISTSPLSYKRWDAGARPSLQTITNNLARVAEELVRARRELDCLIHLDIEPEPDGLLENSKEVVAFYQDWLLPVGGALLADAMNISPVEARKLLLDHVRVCFDTCHFAVEYEDPKTALDHFSQAGIMVGRAQVSSALSITLPDDDSARQVLRRQLETFADETYLHQTFERRDGGALRRFPDLPDALSAIDEPGPRELRSHFHVPLFADQFGRLSGTQEYIRSVFRLLQERRFTTHLEIETYTWEVLPTELKQALLESIHREYRWVIEEIKKCEKQS